MKGLRYVIALFHVSLIARANIENITAVIIIVVAAVIIIVITGVSIGIVIVILSRIQHHDHLGHHDKHAFHVTRANIGKHHHNHF